MQTLKIKDRKGFTLVEVLVVVMIVGILATAAVGGYTSYRRSALLSLSADDIVSQIYTMRDKTIHGDYESNRKAKIVEALESGAPFIAEEDVDVVISDAECFGFFYEGGGDISLFSDNYDVQKAYDVNHMTWDYKACGEVDDIVPIEFKKDKIINLESVKAFREDGGEVSINSGFYVRFSPPGGEVEYFIDDNDPADLDVETVVVTIRYGDNNLTNLVKNIVFNLEEETIYVRND